ncbi:MAG: beta-aspartyl-peptidase [Candidatus Aminicenantes bacterium]|nr:beta-aspartyl-peptidase [Candidatus Aminicenantes bacterium]
MILFKGCRVYAPEFLGRKDVLVAGGTIAALGGRLQPAPGCKTETVDGRELRLLPGLIDCHVHIAGAGGEGGPATRTPEIRLSDLLEGGITTVIGCLGTDGLTRSLAAVLMKAKGLRQEGLSAWIYTGSYQVPPPTLLGDVGKDIALIDEVIGVGEIAIADHRSSNPSQDEIIRLAKQARVGGMLGNKAGIVNIHLGDAPDPFGLLYGAVANSELRFSQFLPTHCNRTRAVFAAAKKYARKGYIDLTASSFPFYTHEEIKPSAALRELLRARVPLEHVTVSSDGGGSFPDFDEQGNLRRLAVGRPKAIFSELIDAVRQERIPLEKALPPVTSNVAAILKLPRKGRIAVGMDADLLALDDRDRIHGLLAGGRWLIRDGKAVLPGTFA